MATKIIVTMNPTYENQLAADWGKEARAIGEDAATISKILANKDTGDMAASVESHLEQGKAYPLPDVVVEAHTNYAIWQELEPGDRTEDGSIRRVRKGGKAFLRPGLIGALSKRKLL